MASPNHSPELKSLPPTRFTRSRAFRSVLAWWLWLGCFAWLLDELWLLLSRAPAEPQPGWLAAWLHGAWVGFFTSGVASLGLGALVGLLWAWSIGPQSSLLLLARITSRIHRWLRDGERAEHERRVAGVWAGLHALVLFASGFVGIGSGLVLSIARPQNLALALLGLGFGLALASALLVPLLFRWSLFWVRLYGRIPVFGRLVHKTWRAVLVLLLDLAVAVAVTLVLAWGVLSFLPWAGILSVLFASSLALLACWAQARLVSAWRWTGYALFGLFCLLFVASGVTGFRLKQAPEATRMAMAEGLTLGRLGYTMISTGLDVDRDGIAFGFGGGDCAPFDPKVFPGAIDIPGNGTDENCDGADLDASLALDFKGRFDHPRPPGFPRQPHIVLISVDALAPRQLGAFAASPPATDITPRLSALSRQSVSFHACFAQGPSTRLSLPAMFTSRYDSEIKRRLAGRFPYEIMPENQLLAELVKARGYHTAAVLPERYFLPTNWRGLTQGFDYVDSEPAKLLSKGKSHNAPEVADAAIAVMAAAKAKPEQAPEGGNLGGAAANPSPSWDGKQPLFMWVHFYDAHWPHEQPEGSPVYGRSVEDRYRAELNFVDRHIGRLLDAITEELGDDTLIVLTADHGVGFDKHRHAKTGYGHDLSSVVLHVPMMWHHPRLKPRRVDSLCSTLDLLPTLSNLVGLKPKGPVRGTSLVPELSGKPAARRLLFHQYFLPEQRVRKKEPLRLVVARSDQYSLLLNRERGDISAWNWRADPDEVTDLWPGEQGTREAQQLSELRQLLDLHVYELRR